MMEYLMGWTGLILGFSGLIFIHELGHFALAKWNGVRVYVFSLGMGPYIFSFTYKGTVYALSLIPIGGYVKMMGQDDLNPTSDSTPDPHDYRNKRPGQRAAILAAGAAFNIILTIVIFTVCYLHGMDMDVPMIGNVSPDTPLAHATIKTPTGDQKANLQEGTRILAVNGILVKNQFEAMLQVSGNPKGKDIILRVDRPAPDDLVYVSPEKDQLLGATGIGLNPYWEREKFFLGFATKDNVYAAVIQDKKPADIAGLKPNDIIKRVNGQPVEREEDLTNAIRGSEGKKIDLDIVRKDEATHKDNEMTLSIVPKIDEKTGRYQLGVGMGLLQRVTQVDAHSQAAKAGVKPGDYFQSFQPEEEKWDDSGTRHLYSKGTLRWKQDQFDEKETVKSAELTGLSAGGEGPFVIEKRAKTYLYHAEGGFWDALSVGWTDTVHFGASVFTVLKGIFTGDVGAGALSGPGGIAKAMYSVASSQAFVKFMWFLGFISLNLGVLQFVPIPLLDGWHLLMVFVEKIKGSPVAPKILEISQVIGIVIVGSLLLFATYNDFLRH